MTLPTTLLEEDGREGPIWVDSTARSSHIGAPDRGLQCRCPNCGCTDPDECVDEGQS